MARCLQSAQEFIHGAFPITIGALASEDAEAICQKNDLSFVELIRPFCQLSSEARIQDPVNPSIIIPVKNLKIRVIDIQSCSPPPVLVNRVLTEVVNKSVAIADLTSRLSVENQINASTPWYEAYRDCFFQLMQPMSHEFIRDFLACILVVSTKHPDPMHAFAALSSRQNSIQHSTAKQRSSYKWFSNNTFRYFLLLHDVSDGEEAKADAVYQSMKSVYGSHTCFLLQINSRNKMYPQAADSKMNFSDPWSQHIYPFSEETLDIDESELETNGESVITSQKDADKKEEAIVNELENIEKQLEQNQNNPPSLSFNDPLTSMHYDDMLDEAEDSLGPLSLPKGENKNGVRPRKLSERSLKLQEYKKSLKQFSYSMVTGQNIQNTRKERGHCMTLVDQDKIKAFIYEFVVRGLLPHVEKLMRTISEQILARRGIHKSIFNATKKWFGSNKAPSTGGSVGSFSAGSSYHSDSPELQHRRLGDLSFLVQHYELAYNSYHSAKREFNNDHAWLHFAGALEMSAVSAFMQGTYRVYPVHYFEACISTYLNTCRMPELATRACLMSTEALKARNMYPEAAVEFTKLTHEDSDLRSALLLEQAAHCYLHNNSPMIRKYAFHMILAGHRYSKVVQRKHTLRCYVNALQVYEDEGWHLAEDHVNFITGRQSFNLGNLNDAQLALKSLLLYESQQAPSQQASHLREFLAVFKQNLKSKGNERKEESIYLPELPLPNIEFKSIRCLLYMSEQTPIQNTGTPVTPTTRRSRTVKAASYTFQKNYAKSYIKQWSELEKRIVTVVTGEAPYPFRPFSPCISKNTDNRSNPVIAVEEPFAYEIQFSNPLKIPLNMLQLSLLWEFTPDDSPSSIKTNRESEQPECIWTDIIDNFLLRPLETKMVCLKLTAKAAGQLKIVGVKYTLSSVGVTSSVDEYEKTNLSTYQEAVLRAVGVTGIQEIVIKGPRLNSTKKQRADILYGVDKMLEPCILPELPLLQVTMMDIPVTLLCGEVQRCSFHFRNIGQVALKNLFLICSHPECFSFGKDIDKNYTKLVNISEDNTSCYVKVHTNSNNRDIIKIPVVSIEPKEEVAFPLCVYGLNSTGVHEIDFLFYYEPCKIIKKMPYRLLQQSIRLQTLSTLTVSASSQLKSYSEQEESISKLRKEEIIISLSIENRSQGSFNLHCVEFTLKQLLCYSTKWKVKSLVDLPQETYKLRPGENCSLHLKTSTIEEQQDSHVFISEVYLGEIEQENESVPSLELFMKSSKNVDAALKSLGLIVYWETFYIDEGFTRNVINGQSHMVIMENNQMVDNTSTNLSLIPTINGINLSYQYAAIVSHSFSKSRLCVVPIEIKCSNISNYDAKIEFDAIDLQEQSGNGQVTTEKHSLNLIQWVGNHHKSIVIPSNSCASITMHALFTSTGLFEIQNIAGEFVRNSESEEQIILNLPNSQYICIEE